MHYLVTGGCGFIGSHLCEKLLSLSNNKVTIIDNLSSGNLNNISLIKNHPNLILVKKNLSDKNIEKYFTNVDCVMHLAALSDIIPSVSQPKIYFESNVKATINLLEIMRSKKIKKIVYAASSSCYGIPNQFPTTERAKIDTRYPYSFTKYIAEQSILHWANVYNIKAISLRLFNVYGPRVRTVGHYGAVFGVFLAQLANNYPITIVGNGNQKRDFTFVSDVVRAFLAAAKSNFRYPEIFNIGCQKPIAINKLVRILNPKKIKYIQRRPGEPKMTFACIKKAKKKLKWTPKISFKEGLGFMMKELNNWKKAPLWTETKIKEATREWFKFVK